ncbi:MAG: right-handed parallel beta-helix repeat-containing protein [Fibrobacteres bacterium]|nr:right-handed parallel beta-helix repeat-containing protein [Fibrobacterota bacterium]
MKKLGFLLFFAVFCYSADSTHVFWNKCVTNGYSVSSNPGPNLPSVSVKHEGMVATGSYDVSGNFVNTEFSLGSGHYDNRGKSSFVWFKDLNHLQGTVTTAKLRGEYKDGFSDTALCSNGPISLRVGIVDFSQNLNMMGGESGVPENAVWQDYDNRLQYDMSYSNGFTGLMAEDSVNISALSGRSGRFIRSVLDKQFFEIDVTKQINWILSHTGSNKGGFSGQYAIVLLSPVGKGSTGRVTLYSTEDGILGPSEEGSDSAWTSDGNTIHLVASGNLIPAAPDTLPGFIFDVWNDADSAAVTVGLNNFKKTVDSIFVYRDSILIHQQKNEFYRIWDVNTSIYKNAFYTLAIKYTDASTDTFFKYYRAYIPSFNGWFRNDIRRIVIDWGFSGARTDSYELFRDGVKLGSFPDSVRSFTDNGADPYQDHRYKMVFHFVNNGRTDSIFYNYQAAMAPEPELWCGNTSLLQTMMSGKGVVYKQRYSTHHRNVTSVSLPFTIPSFEGGIYITGNIDSIGFDTLVAIAAYDTCSHLPIYKSGQDNIVFAALDDISWLRGPTMWTWFNHASKLPFVNWNNVHKPVKFYTIYRDGVYAGTPSINDMQYADTTADIYTDHNYQMIITYQDFSTDTLNALYSRQTPPQPQPYCGSPSVAGNVISTKGLLCRIGGDSLFRQVTNPGVPFPAPKSPMHTLVVGKVDSITDTLVILGKGDSCGSLFLSNGKAVAAKLNEYNYIRGVQFWAYYDNWPKKVRVDWTGIGKSVNYYEILRNSVRVATFPGVNGTGWIDTAVSPYANYTYRLRVFFMDSTADSADADYKAVAIPPPAPFCGTRTEAQNSVNSRGITCISNHDSLLQNVSIAGPVFPAPKSPSNYLIPGKIGTASDTFVILGSGDSCGKLHFAKDSKQAVARLNEYSYIRGPTLNVWYHDGMQVVKIQWNGIGGSVDYFELLRDGQTIVSNYNGTWNYDDYSADAFTNHTYLLRIFKSGVAIDSLTAGYMAKNPYQNPVVWCGSPGILQDTLSRHGSSLRVHWDTLPIPVSRVDNPFSNSKYPGAVLMLGEWFDKEKNVTVTDTMVAMGINGKCASLIMSKTSAAYFWRLKDCYMLQPPYFSAWWQQDSGFIRVEWGNFKRPVEGYVLYRDTTRIYSATGTNVWHFFDRSGVKENNYQYKILVNYQDSTSEWFYANYSNQGGNTGKEMPPIYCGTDAMLTAALAGKTVQFIVPWDSAARPFTRSSNPFLLQGTSNVWALLGKEGSNTYSDTFLALGKIGTCSDPLFSKDMKSVVFARIQEYPFIRGPRLMSWFFYDSNCVSLNWGGFQGTVTTATLFRDNQFVKSFPGSSTFYNDYMTDPSIKHLYVLIVKTGTSTDTLYSNYSKDGDGGGSGGGRDFNFDGKWGYEGSYTFNLMKMTGNKADSGKSGYVYRWGIKKESVIIDSVTRLLQTPVTFNVSFRKITDASFINLLSFSVKKADSCYGYNVKDTVFGIGIYQKRVIVVAGAEIDTIYNYFTSGVAVPVSLNNVISINLSKIASVNLGTKSTAFISNYSEDGKLLPAPSGNMLTFSHTVPNVNTIYKTISYIADGLPFGLILMASGTLEGGQKTLSAGPAKEDGYVTFDGTVRMEIEGEGIPKSASDMQQSGRQDKILFSSLRIYSGSMMDTVKLPLDSGKVTFNSGPDHAGKRISIKGIDTLLGITVDAPAGRVFHIGASDKSVVGITNGTESRYYTVAAAVMAGEKTIKLPAAEYKGMPIALYQMAGITITGEIQGEKKTLIDADGNDAGIWLKEVASIGIRGVSVRKGNVSLSANTVSGITFAQCRVTGSLNGVVIFAPEGDSFSTLSPKTKNCTIENCVADSIAGFAFLIDRPVDCRIANNTVVSAVYGAYMGRGGNSRKVSLPLTGNTASNNIFRNCKAGFVQGLDNSMDNIGFTYNANIFQSCDSGAFSSSYTTDPVFRTVRQSAPAGCIEIAANENSISASFPYIPVIGSSVHDKGLRTSMSPLTDFRGSPRVLSNSLDIGAFELFDLRMGFNLLAKRAAEGCAFVRYTLTAPDSGSFTQVQMVLKKDGAAFTSGKTMLEQMSNSTVVTWYPLVQGSYQFDFSTRYTSTMFDTTFTLSDTFSVQNDAYVVKGGLWNMVGYADASNTKVKQESAISALSDSSLYVWDQTTTSYSLLSSQPDTLVHRGSSYWNMPDSDVTISWAPEVYSAPDTSDFILNLKAGWNLVSSPFPFAVAVPGKKFWHYDNILADYRGYDLLRPLAGSWILADSNTAITVKYKPGFGDTAFAAKISGVQYRSSSDWSIALLANVAGKNLEGRIAGVSSEAKGLLEPLPPIGPSGVSVWFQNGKAAGVNAKLFKELKKPDNENYEWIFVVEPSGRKGEVTISGDGIKELEAFKYVYVGSPSTGFTDIKQGSHTFNSDGKRTALALIVTNDKGIMDRYTADFSLAQNTPNPFNPITSISFFVPMSWDTKEGFISKERTVELSIYDIRGKRVATLSRGQLAGGKMYTVNYDAKNSPSGVYFCKLVSGKYESTRKMLLVR